MHWVQKMFDILFSVRADEARVRTLTPENVRALYSPHVVYTTRPYTVALFEMHESSVRALIHEVKYHGNKRAIELLGDMLAQFLETITGDVCIIPIPLSTKRLRERGFNQTELIAKSACQTRHDTSWRVDTSLVARIRHTASQVSLPRRKRIENVRGAFIFTGKPAENCTYIVLDDVTTTGATMQEVLNVLAGAGIDTVLPVVLAH